MDKLADHIEQLAKSEVLAQQGEAATRQAAVQPTLEMLGWNSRNLNEVVPEYQVRGGGRIDYCLRSSGGSLVHVEVKRMGTDLTPHQEQLLRYAFEEGVQLAVLTDGLIWWVYLPRESGGWEQRRFFTIDFRRQSSERAAQYLRSFLQREAVVDGAAVEAAKVEFAEQERQRRVRDTLPIAWKQLLAGPDELLAELLAETVAGISGHRPDPEILARFLLDALPSQTVTAPTVATAIGQARRPPESIRGTNVESFKGRKPIAFTLLGGRHEVKTWRGLLQEVCDIASARVGMRQFQNLVIPIRGAKNEYFGVSPEALRQPLPIKNGGIFVEGKINADQAVDLARRVLAIRLPLRMDSATQPQAGRSHSRSG